MHDAHGGRDQPGWIWRVIDRLGLSASAVLIPTLIAAMLSLPGLMVNRSRVDTAFYAAVSLNAWREGQWWTLMAGLEPYFNKPPLAFWIDAVFMGLFGTSLIVVKLPVYLAAVACIAATVLMVRELSSVKVAFAAGLVLALTHQMPHYTSRFILDYHHLLFMLLAGWALCAGVSRERGWLIMLSGVGIGLALMIKPIFALGIIPVAAVWLIVIGRARYLIWLFGSLVVSLIIAGPWHVSMSMIHGDVFVDQYFGRETLRRATGAAFEGEPWWWYVSFLIRSYWPWMLTVAAAVLALVRTGCLDSKDRRAELFCVLWCVLWLVAASVFSDKRDRYIMHIYPMLAWLSALWMVRLAPEDLRVFGRKLLQPIVVGTLIFGIAGSAAFRVMYPPRQRYLKLNEFIGNNLDKPIYNGSLWNNALGKIYMANNIWLTRGEPNDPDLPDDALLVYQTRNEPFVPQGAEVVFEASDPGTQSKLVVIKAHIRERSSNAGASTEVLRTKIDQ